MCCFGRFTGLVRPFALVPFAAVVICCHVARAIGAAVISPINEPTAGLTGEASTARSIEIQAIVGQVIRPLMASNGIPGMAVGILIHGRSYAFNYGLASISPKRPVTDDTLFEVGSISKTFTATLATYSEVEGNLSVAGMTSQYLPSLRGSAFDRVSLIDLGTHTPGGMPLQVPNGIQNQGQLLAYFKTWKPAYTPGTVRTYGNPGIGLLGIVTATTMHAEYSDLVQELMFPAFGMSHSFIQVPKAQAANYAQGYTDEGAPIRLVMGPAGPEAYGVRTTARDFLRFLAVNMGLIKLGAQWQSAVLLTHTGYYQLKPGGMVQDLVWEQYNLPVTLAILQAGNGPNMLLQPNPATSFNPPLSPKANVWIDKSGSTNGFSSYTAFIPSARAGIILLANRSYPMFNRIKTAFEIMARLKISGIAANG